MRKFLLNNSATLGTISKPMTTRRARLCRSLLRDCNGVAAIEFAMVLPLMLALFFGTVEICAGVALQRKVTIVASSMQQIVGSSAMLIPGDLAVRQWPLVKLIATPYDTTLMKVTATEVYVSTSGVATVMWSYGDAARAVGDVVSLQDGFNLSPSSSYVILIEASYYYTPTVAWFTSPIGVNLTDVATSRPGTASGCVIFNPPDPSSPPPCPTPNSGA